MPNDFKTDDFGLLQLARAQIELQREVVQLRVRNQALSEAQARGGDRQIVLFLQAQLAETRARLAASQAPTAEPRPARSESDIANAETLGAEVRHLQAENVKLVAELAKARRRTAEILASRSWQIGNTFARLGKTILRPFAGRR